MYDRSAQKQAKKAKKGKSGGQQVTRHRQHYSPMIPTRKTARMLQSSGVEFVARAAMTALETENNLRSLAKNGAGGEYGDIIQQLAQQAVERLDVLKAAPKKVAEPKTE
ncbi:MAG: hypothetical protein Q8L24_01825 [bacterium]|nr:hypothetical protein [bacterium]